MCKWNHVRLLYDTVGKVKYVAFQRIVCEHVAYGMQRPAACLERGPASKLSKRPAANLLKRPAAKKLDLPIHRSERDQHHPTPPHPTFWSYVSSSLSCCWPVRYQHHPPQPTPHFGLMYPQVCLAADHYIRTHAFLPTTWLLMMFVHYPPFPQITSSDTYTCVSTNHIFPWKFF